MTIGEFIRKHREQMDLTQHRLSVLMPGWYPTTASRIEADIQDPKFADVVLLSRLLNFDLADIASLVPQVDVCARCGGRPMTGFTCNECGRSS